MGRKATEKTRKPKSHKTDQWLTTLLPKLQDLDLDHLSMDSLAALIPKSKSTLYDYFGSREEIIYDAVSLKLRELAGYQRFLTEPNALICYQKLLRFLSEGLQEIKPNFLRQLPHTFPEAWQLILTFQQSIILDLTELYAKGIEEGIFKNLPLKLIVGFDIHFINHVITDADLDNVPIKQLIEAYVELKMKGLTA